MGIPGRVLDASPPDAGHGLVEDVEPGGPARKPERAYCGSEGETSIQVPRPERQAPRRLGHHLRPATYAHGLIDLAIDQAVDQVIIVDRGRSSRPGPAAAPPLSSAGVQPDPAALVRWAMRAAAAAAPRAGWVR